MSPLQSAPHSSDTRAPNRPGQGVRILIVDDRQDNLRMLGSLLKNKGYLVHVASNGEAALRIAREIVPELLLLDVQIPQLDGFEICERLKQDSVTRDIPVVFLTVRDSRESVLRAFRLGAVDYVTKPFDQVELLVRVRTHTTLGRLMKGLRDEVEQHTQWLNEANNKLSRLATELVLTEERERHRVATEIHDSTIQKLALAQIRLESTQCPGLADGVQLVEESIQELRNLVFDLSPPVLYELGLGAALEWMAHQAEARWSIPFDCRIGSPLDHLPQETCILVFQSARELVTNVAKHAQATCGLIEADLIDLGIRVSVADDGLGLEEHALEDRAEEPKGFGLFSIKQRMEQLGGILQIEPQPVGSKISMILPINNHDD